MGIPSETMRLRYIDNPSKPFAIRKAATISPISQRVTHSNLVGSGGVNEKSSTAKSSDQPRNRAIVEGDHAHLNAIREIQLHGASPGRGGTALNSLSTFTNSVPTVGFTAAAAPFWTRRRPLRNRARAASCQTVVLASALVRARSAECDTRRHCAGKPTLRQ